jgi:hypothetical protein
MPWTSQAILKGADGAPGSTGPAGGVFGSVIADFGSSDNGGSDAMSVTVTVAASWLTSTSYPIVELVSGADHLDADDLTSEEVYAFVTNIQTGTSFDIEVFAPNGTQGQWLVNWGAAVTGSNDPTKASTSTTISAGDGLSGGGSLAANRTLAVDGTVVRSTDTRLSPYNIAVNGIIPGGYNRRISYDDFISGLDSRGQLGWGGAVSGTGASFAAVTTTTDSTNKALGVVALSTGTTTTGLAYASLTNIPPGAGAYEQNWRIYLGAQPSSAQNYLFWCGLEDGALGTNSILLVINFSAGSALMYGEANGGGGTSDTTKVACVADGAYFKLKIVINAAWNSVSFFVNGTQVGSAITTNIPSTVSMFPVIRIGKTAGTTAVLIYLDQYMDDYIYSV